MLCAGGRHGEREFVERKAGGKATLREGETHRMTATSTESVGQLRPRDFSGSCVGKWTEMRRVRAENEGLESVPVRVGHT